MRKLFVVPAVLVVLVSLCLPAMAQSDDATTVVATPAIYLPAGGKIVTEINVSDDDVLGIIKQSIPAVADIVKDIASKGASDPGAAVVMSFASASDVGELSQAIEGIKNVRVLIVRYPQSISPERFVNEFGAGVQKAGPFRKILSDYGNFPGAVAIYALPNNAGCMGFAYVPSEHTAYAMRVVGGVDVPRLIKWAGGIAKLAIGRRDTSDQIDEPEEAKPAPVPDAAPVPAEAK